MAIRTQGESYIIMMAIMTPIKLKYRRPNDTKILAPEPVGVGPATIPTVGTKLGTVDGFKAVG